MTNEQTALSVKLQAMQEYGALVIKLVDIFGADEVVKMLRASARVVASGKAAK
jgi:hypothetical protein